MYIGPVYKQVFQNSKVALLFAGMTLFSAVSLIGTPEDSGVLPQAVDLVEAQRSSFANDVKGFAEGRSVGDKPGSAPSVFGDYDASAQPSDDPAAIDEDGSDDRPYILDREMTIVLK